MKIAYDDKSFASKSLVTIEKADEIIEDYQAQGYKLTLRQLYYRFVASVPGFENSEKSYKNFGQLISDARLTGRLDWDAIEDRTRNLMGLGHYDSPADILSSSAWSYHRDRWEDQEVRPELWVEKEALAAIVERTALRNDVNYLCCRGYMSQSEMHEAALRFVRYFQKGQTPIIIHLGDHDPSGMDMTRDVTDRAEKFVSYHLGRDVEVQRIALNMSQIEQYEPPPNPVKLGDVRSSGYTRRFGEKCWELDALEPSVLDGLMQAAIDSVRDPDKWAAACEREEFERKTLQGVSDNWPKIEKLIASGKLDTKPKKATKRKPKP